MVLMQRQSSCPPRYYGGSQLPMGNDEQLPSSYEYNTMYSGYPSVDKPIKLTASKKSTALPKWVLPAAYAIAVISWLSAFRVNGHLTTVYNGIQSEIDSLGLQREESLRFLEDSKASRKELMKEQKKLKRSQRLINHELRMLDEIYEAHLLEGNEETRKIIQERQKGISKAWIQQRQETLNNKIYTLQDFIREQSRQRVLQKYGPGPHRVQFQVVPHGTTDKNTRFVVELAPLDLVPHSIETFLDMVTNNLWDNTVFYHHSSQDHVIAAAPVNFGTFETKHYHFAALGYNGVSFPEYSPSFPHEKYTIGFSGTGPNFYINTMDNQDHHGPGGQGHHDLPTDADPCFGKIVVGASIVEKMSPGTRNPDEEPISWHDFDLSHIVKVELLVE